MQGLQCASEFFALVSLTPYKNDDDDKGRRHEAIAGRIISLDRCLSSPSLTNSDAVWSDLDFWSREGM